MKQLLAFLVATGVLTDDSDNSIVDLMYQPDHNDYGLQVFDGINWLPITNIWAGGTDGNPNFDYFAWVSCDEVETDIQVRPDNLRAIHYVTEETVRFA